MSYTLWFDPEAPEDEYVKVWCVEGSRGWGYWLNSSEGIPLDVVERIEETVNDPLNPLDLDSMCRFKGLENHGKFDSAEEAVNYIKMQKLME